MGGEGRRQNTSVATVYFLQNMSNICWWGFVHQLRGVPTEGRKPCDCKYRRIKRVHRSVGILLCCDRGHSSKIVSTKMVFFWFRLNSNMFNISFSMSIFSYQNWSKNPEGTPIFDVFR